MFNLSDILKKQKEAKEAKQEQEPVVKKEDKKPPEEVKKLNISSVVPESSGSSVAIRAQKAYTAFLEEVRSFYSIPLEKIEKINQGIFPAVDNLVNVLSTGDDELCKLSLSDYPVPDDYLYYHVTNVCVLCVEIGISLGFKREQLIDLAKASFFHDIGLTAFTQVINKEKLLSKHEHHQVEEHPVKGAEFLKRIGKDLSPIVITAVLQEHERLDGSGYPFKLKDKDIGEFARIISFSDEYEALIHSRPDRVKFSPLEAIKKILNNKAAFDSHVAKAFIERVGIFPLGVLVQLNTKEIGVVIKANPRLPLRPIVSIIVDANGKKSSEEKQIDLSQNSMIYVEDCLKDFRL